MIRRLTLFLMVVGLAIAPLSAQRNRDPLSEKEADQLREVADQPHKRISLLVKYARARMAMIEQIRSDQKMATDQADKLSELLEDFAYLVDELEDNLSNYNSKGEDLRKPLREVIGANTDFQLKLRTIKETSSPDQLRGYSFALESATESVNASADSSRAMLDDQLAKKGKEKESKPEKEDKSANKSSTPKPDKDNSPKQRPDYTGMGGIGQTPR